MRGKIRVLSVSIMLFFVAVLTIHAGGPPIVTIEKLPEYFVVGQPSALKFAVRSYCCNHLPLENLYTVRAIAAGPPVINASAMPTKIPGEYTATLTLPRPGKWTITVETGNHVFTALLPIDAIPAGAPTPKPLSQVARGERLFVEKGCTSCHVNRDAATPEVRVVWRDWSTGGPLDLTGRSFPAEYLREFLADPGSARKGTGMPDLRLTPDDIDLLVAFINKESPHAK